jgi:predicted O-linked N-acetylglucosamine transferase (SPINDLY family)
MATTLQQFIQTSVEKQTDAKIRNGQAYHEMLTDLANDIAVDEAELEIVLQMVGKTTGQLADDVEIMRKRIERYRDIQRHDDLLKQSQELIKEVERLQSEYAKIAKPIIDELERAKTDEIRCAIQVNAMRTVLSLQEGNCMNLALLETEKALRQKLVDVTAKHQPLRKKFLWWQNLRDTNSGLPPSAPKDYLEAGKARRIEAEKRMQELQKLIDPLEKGIREIGQQLAELQKEKLKP